MNKYYLKFNNLDTINNKSHDIFNNYIKKKYIELKINRIEELFEFIKNNKNIKLIMYYQGHRTNIYSKIIKFLNYKNYSCKFILFTFDFWAKQIKKYDFKAKKHKVICFARNIEQLNFYHNFDFTEYKENLIFLNLWSCYNSSYIKFNEKPIYKILLSGRLHKRLYPERYIINRYNNIIRYNHIGINNINNNDIQNIQTYNLELNKYFACFSSSVYVICKITGKYENTHIILLKTFEILASGSLLVMPLKEEEYIKEIGLVNMKNCYLIDFSKDRKRIQSQINYIFENIKLFNKIRRDGQIHAKENLNSTKKIEELKSLIDI